MKNLYSLIVIMLVLMNEAFPQSSSTTYSSGDIDTDFAFQSLPGSSTCPGTLTVNIPSGVVITSVDVEYDMTAVGAGWMAEQRSQLRCTSTGGTNEATLAFGTGNATGTMQYSRTGLTIANGVTGGGDITFELHAGRTYGGSGCNTDYNIVDNDTWTVTVHYTIGPGYPSNPDPSNDAEEVALNGTLNWDFGDNTDTYDLWFGPYGSMVEVASDQPAASTGLYTYSGLDPSSRHQWQVIAHNTNGTTNGLVWEFTTVCQAISTFPYTENFDNWGTSSPAMSCTPDGTVSLKDCWSNASGDDIDWDKYSGASPSTSTGPGGDHTSGSGIYLYTEASGCYTQTGWIYTPEFDFTGVFPTLSFCYHMYGLGMGTLSIQASTDDGSTWSSDLISLSGNQGDQWMQAAPNIGYLENESSVIFRITGLTGIDYRSDMAIDDFEIGITTDPVAYCDTDSIGFGEFSMNNYSGGYYTRTVNLQNIGPGTVTVTSVSLAGSDASDFSLSDTNTYPKELSGLDLLGFETSFDPGSLGNKSASIEIVHSEGTTSIPLSGEAYVAGPQNLSGSANIYYGVDLSWDPPLPEGEIRYDDGNITSYYYFNPSTVQNYYYTRLTPGVSGDLNTIAIFCRTSAGGPGWNEILVCPDNGSGEPNISNPYETFSNVPVTSTTGEWIILDLTSPVSLTDGVDFYILAGYPEGSTTGPYLAANNTINYNRCARTFDAGATWLSVSRAFIMRGYMTISSRASTSLQSGIFKNNGIEIPLFETDQELNEFEPAITPVPLPGIFYSDAGRDLTDYTVLRGSTANNLNTQITGISDTSYTDNDPALVPGQTYFYGVIAAYPEGNSDTSNIVQATITSLPTAPTNPTPADIQTDVQPDNTTLSWTNNGNVQFVDLYLSMTQDSVINKIDGSAMKLDNVPVISTHDPGQLAEGTWYWRVAVSDGVARTEVDGPVWSFTVSDTVPPSISYDPLTRPDYAGSQTLTALITDISGVPTAGTGLPVCYWKVNHDGIWRSAQAVFAGSNQFEFMIGYLADYGDTVYYYVAAQDLSLNLNVGIHPSAGASGFSVDPPAASTPPTAPDFYPMRIPYSGTYTIGTGGGFDFSSLTETGGFFDAINNGMVTGQVTANIMTDLGPENPYEVYFNQVFRSGGNHRITLQPDPTVTDTFQLELKVILNGADYVTFYGNNKRLKIYHYDYNYSGAIELTNGASNNIIEECFIVRDRSHENYSSCIYFEGIDNNDNVIVDNVLTDAYCGIKFYKGVIGYCSGNKIIDNIIGSDTSWYFDPYYNKYIIDLLHGIYEVGIDCSFEQNLLISGNEIKHIHQGTTGIRLNICSNLIVINNYIHDVGGDASGLGYSLYGNSGIDCMLDCEFSSSQVLICNNQLRKIWGYDDVYTIKLKKYGFNKGEFNIFYNSIYMQPDSLFAINYGGTGTRGTSGIVIASSVGEQEVNFQNNIIYNCITKNNYSSNIVEAYAIICEHHYPEYSPFNAVDCNVYFGDCADSNFVGLTGYYSNPPDEKTKYRNLNEWKNFTGQEQHSQWINPQFINDYLELNEGGATRDDPSPAIGAGQHLYEVLYDRDSIIRHALYPTIGAYDYDPPILTPGLWTGMADDDWDNPGNWETNELPYTTDTVIIPTLPKGERFPVIGTGVIAECDSISIYRDATLEIQNGGSLNILDNTAVRNLPEIIRMNESIRED